MVYRIDSDLEFLKIVPSSELEALVEILTKDKDGASRFTEELSTNERYKEYFPDHSRYWDLIAAELQRFAGNSIVTKLRGGEGIFYKEALTDVCDRMKVNYNKGASVEMIEMNLMMKILTDSMQKMSPEDLKSVVEDLDLNTKKFTAEAVTIALQAAVKLGGFAAYRVSLIVANAVAKAVIGKGLAFAANAALMRTIGIFAGPIGWALTAIWTLVEIAGPAYRVTIPAVIQVAFLRARTKYVQEVQ